MKKVKCKPAKICKLCRRRCLGPSNRSGLCSKCQGDLKSGRLK